MDCLGFEEGAVLLFMSFYFSLEIFNHGLVSQSLLYVCCPNVHMQSTVILEVLAVNIIAV